MKKRKRTILAIAVAICMSVCASSTTASAGVVDDILELLYGEKITCWSACTESETDYFVFCDTCERAQGSFNDISQGFCRRHH